MPATRHRNLPPLRYSSCVSRGAYTLLSVSVESTMLLKSGRLAIWNRYFLAVALGLHANTRLLRPRIARKRMGGVRIFVKTCDAEYGPGVVPPAFGNSPRTL